MQGGPDVQPQRVNIDDMDTFDGYTFLVDGRPFTGIGYELGETGFSLEITFVDGIQTGERSLDPDGNLIREIQYLGGQLHGSAREYSADKTLLVDEWYEFGTLVEGLYRDESGALVRTFHLPDDDPRRERLSELRRILES
jgi:hypothetical protein